MARTKSIHVNQEVGEDNKLKRNDLAQLVNDTLNKAQKDGAKVATFLSDEPDPSMVSDWISTGSTLLDLAISNRKNGGLPSGRICELSGLEGCVTEDNEIEIIID